MRRPQPCCCSAVPTRRSPTRKGAPPASAPRPAPPCASWRAPQHRRAEIAMRPVLFAALGGVFHFLGLVGFGIWPLGLICLLPLWQGLEESRGRLRDAALVGFTFGWISYAGGYLWLWRIVDVLLGGNVLLGAAIWLADSIWFAARYALYAVLYARVRRRGRSVALAAVPALVGV